MRTQAEKEERWRDIYNDFKEDYQQTKERYLDPVKNANFFVLECGVLIYPD